MGSDSQGITTFAFPGGLRTFLIRAVAGSGAVHLIGMAFTFLIGIQLARGLGVEGYGVYGIAMAAIALASIPGEFGLPRLVTRETAAAPATNDMPRLFGILNWANRTALMLSLSAALLLAVGGFAFARGNGSAVAWAILIGAPIVPLVALMKIRGAALQGLNFVVLGLIPNELLRPMIFSILLFALFLAYPGAGASEALGAYGLAAAVSLAVAYFWLRARLPRPKPATIAVDHRRWLASSLRIALADGLRMSHAQLLILLLGVLGSVAAVGLFRIATSIAIMISVPITLLNVAVAPVIARLWADGDTRRLQSLCTHAARWMTLGTLALSLPFVFWGPELLTLVFGADFADANAPLLILACSQIGAAALGPNLVLLTMTGHEGRVTGAMLIGLLVGIAIAAVAIPLWGEIGAAIAFLASVMAWNIVTWFYSRRLLAIETSVLAVIR